MSVVTGVAIYFVVWWTVLFAVLPWGSRPPDTVEPGMADSAPARPRLALKFLVTTIVSGIVFGIILAIYNSGLVSFRPPRP